MKMLFRFALVIVSLLFVSPVFAASVRVIPSGAGVYVVQAYDLANITGIQLEIFYDLETMKNPRVDMGKLISGTPGAQFLPNPAYPDAPNHIRIVAIQPSTGFNGTGPIAVLSFQPVSGKTGKITNMSVRLIEGESLKEVGVATEVTNPDGTTTTNEPPNQGGTANPGTGDSGSGTKPPTTGGQGTGTTTQGSGSTAATYMGTVTMPGETAGGERPQETARRDQSSEPQQTQPQEARSIPRETEQVASNQETAKAAGEKKFVANKGLQEQFQELKGEVTAKALLDLFAGFSIPHVSQEPPVALSDGKTKVKLVLDLPGGKESPNFALKGAKLVSLTNDEKDKWVIEALPAKGSNDVRLTVLQDNQMTEIPLVVAQAVPAKTFNKEGKLDMAVFDLFLKDRGTEKAPKLDLNGDGVRNYLDDYIFTANYIVKNGMPRKGEAGKQPEPSGKEAPKALPAKK